MTIGDRGQLTDGTRTIELHRLQNLEHTGDLLVVYLPKEGIIAEPDAFTPPAQPAGTLIAPAVPFARALYDHIQRNKLNVQVIVPFHGQPEERRGGARPAGRRQRDELTRRVRCAEPALRTRR